MLLNAGLPPFVINTENAIEYLNISTEMKTLSKKKFFESRRLVTFERQLSQLLREQGDTRYLVSSPLSAGEEGMSSSLLRPTNLPVRFRPA